MPSQSTSELLEPFRGPYSEHMTAETFWEQYEEVADMSETQFFGLWEDAKAEYTGLPFHNFPHGKETLRDAMLLVDFCRANGLPIRHKDLIGATPLHDAGYHVTGHGLSKEAFSAQRHSLIVPRHGFTPTEVSLGGDLIMATTMGATVDTVLKKIMVRADINNVGGDYLKIFMQKTALLVAEDIQLKGREHNYREFVRHSLGALAVYLNNDLSLGPFDTLDWKEQAVSNLDRLVVQAAGDVALPIPDFVRSVGSSALYKLLPRARTMTA